ncbi:hypothetical protein FSP39_012919 [Pinctada imbricata]|uniref:Sulfotransferase domain-containing protein n=1 Tax=Pinctada imbricata TaxID=66713 RepID=A0AA88Y3U8_PINIB|nr:hypothetical protein FSP39_012919 [Pinctada imbricata]
MSEESYIREGRFQRKDGEIEFDFITLDGIGLPPFPAAYQPGGFPKRIKEIQNLDCRADDIILATYPKCGTHWTNEILQMLVKGDANYTKESKMFFMLEALDDLNSIKDFKSPRVLNLHFPYKWFPREHIENGGKIVHTTRNPKDAYVSLFHHARSSLEHGVKTKNMTWDQFFNTCVLGKNSAYGSWFDFEKEIEQAKKVNNNIYTIHFEQLKEDPEKVIKDLAMFLDIPASDYLIKDIAEKCLFQNMKKADKDIKELPKTIEEYKSSHKDFEFPVMYRKGIVGDWKNHFTVSQNEQFDAMFEKEMNGTDVKVLYN